MLAANKMRALGEPQFDDLAVVGIATIAQATDIVIAIIDAGQWSLTNGAAQDQIDRHKGSCHEDDGEDENSPGPGLASKDQVQLDQRGSHSGE